MKAIAYIFAALVLVSAVSLVPAMAQQAPGQEEVKTALYSIVNGLGMILPAEDAFVNFCAVVIIYLWNLVGVLVTIMRLMPMLGEICLFCGDIQSTCWEMIVICNKAWIRSCSTGFCVCGGITACCPATGNLLVMALRALISYILNWCGNMTIDLTNACMPLAKYFPTV